jgi:hypothetical protein
MTPPVAHHLGEESLAPLLLLGSGGGLSLLINHRPVTGGGRPRAADPTEEKAMIVRVFRPTTHPARSAPTP